MIYSVLSQYDNDKNADVAADGLDHVGLSKKTIATYRPSVKKQIVEIYKLRKTKENKND